jgi:hypothetical protein
MKRFVEVSEDGSLELPPSVLDNAPPRTRYSVSVRGKAIVLDRVDAPAPFWATAETQERVVDLERWVASHADGPGLPDEALRREHIYD